MASENPFDKRCKADLTVGGHTYKYYSIPALKDPRAASLPFSIRVLLESALRNCDNFCVTEKDVETILDWQKTSKLDVEIPFKPARVLMQDFTGVPCVVDLCAMRDAVARLGGDPEKVNPRVPADLVIDHSVQVDASRDPESVRINLEMEMRRNSERFQFLKWGAQSFKNFSIVPPGKGIIHQANIERIARVVFHDEAAGDVLFPDSTVGTDSHSTMINGLGVVGWGVGGIEAEAVMMGQEISMVLPEVVGFRLTGRLGASVTATDLVLTITARLRERDVVGKFVEFFGPGLAGLSLADRATIANMAPEYGATMGFFPVDERSVEYMRLTGRDEAHTARAEAYLRAQGLFAGADPAADAAVAYSEVMELDLAQVVACVAGPKRPHDRVELASMKADFRASLTRAVGFKGYGLTAEQAARSHEFELGGARRTLRHGDVVIAAITSCTNTSNPNVIVGAGLLAKRAVELGLTTRDYIKTSLAPGSQVVTKYLERSGLQPYLDRLGFNVVGYGCTSCIGNSGELPAELARAVEEGDIVAAAVLSGNRNFEGRVHASTRANYLASPPLVVAYAIAGTVDIDFETEPLGTGSDGRPVFLRDVWPSSEEIGRVVASTVLPSMFREVYDALLEGTPQWNALQVTRSTLYPWDASSTYIHNPPFFATMGPEPGAARSIDGAYCLLNLGDSITTDHISPAGNIARGSPAALYLDARGVAPADYNTYGARRGNDEVMARGTFANIRLVNKFLGGKAGPRTVHVPSGETMAIFDAAERYQRDGHDLVILGGAMYGNGSSRDWAAKGPFMQGVKCVIAVSFERIHRSNLVGMGVLPCCFLDGESADSLGLTGRERFSIDLTSRPLEVGQELTVVVNGGERTFKVRSRLDTVAEIAYYRHGGILQYVIRKMIGRV